MRPITKYVIAAGLVICLFALIFLVTREHIAAPINDMSYIANDIYNYEQSVSYIDSECVFTVDFDNIEGSIGKVVYKDDRGCRISIQHIVDDGCGRYRIVFRSTGTYSAGGARLVSGVYHETLDYNASGDPLGASWVKALMSCKYNEKIYKSTCAGMSGISYKNGDEFSFHLFPTEAYMKKEIPVDNLGKVEISLSNLVLSEWVQRKG